MAIKKYSIVLKKDMCIGDRYILNEYIDEGSYGYVWKSIRRADGKIVALKIPKNQERGDNALTEGKKLMEVYHPNVIQIYWMGRVEGTFVIEMEYFPGYPLTREISEDGMTLPRSFDTVYDLFEQILNGVEFMHRQKLVHGDLKPDNIMIYDKTVKITDFGTSRLVEDMFVRSADGAGTWAYMAPEVAGSNVRYLNSDTYSLGVILYQFLTGRTPHDTLIQVLHNVPYARPRALNANISVAMEQVILKALERDPEMRFTSIDDFRQAIRKARDAADVPFTPRIVPVIRPRKTRDALEMSMLQCQLKKYDLAEKVLQQELANGNQLPDLLLQLAYVYYRTERLFEAVKLLEDIDTNSVESSRRIGFISKFDYLKARVEFALKHYEVALGLYQKLHKDTPQDINYRYRMAVCYGICGYEEKSIAILEAINQESSGIWAVVKKLGMAYDQKGEFNRARGYYKYALKLRPNDIDVQKRLKAFDFYL